MNLFALLAVDIDVTHFFFLLFNGYVSLFHPSHLEASTDHIVAIPTISTISILTSAVWLNEHQEPA